MPRLLSLSILTVPILFITFLFLYPPFWVLAELGLIALIFAALNHYVNSQIWKLDSVDQECNWVARPLMRRFGFAKTQIIILAGVVASWLPLWRFEGTDRMIVIVLLVGASIAPLSTVCFINDFIGLRQLQAERKQVLHLELQP